MSDARYRQAVLDALAEIAPEADLGSLPGDASMQRELDIDSMDFLNLMAALEESTGVAVPEAEYPRVATLDGCASFLAEHAGDY